MDLSHLIFLKYWLQILAYLLHFSQPVKMEPTWSREEDSLFCDIMKDLRKCVILPELNPEYDYWKMEIWDFIAGMYNDRASAHNFRMRSALDILVHGESVKAQFATQRAVS